MSQTLETGFSVGSFVSFFGAMGLLFSPIKRLTKVNEQLQRGLAASESIFALLAMDTESTGGEPLSQPVRGHLEFRHVNYSYSDQEHAAL